MCLQGEFSFKALDQLLEVIHLVLQLVDFIAVRCCSQVGCSGAIIRDDFWGGGSSSGWSSCGKALALPSKPSNDQS